MGLGIAVLAASGMMLGCALVIAVTWPVRRRYTSAARWRVIAPTAAATGRTAARPPAVPHPVTPVDLVEHAWFCRRCAVSFLSKPGCSPQCPNDKS